MQYEDFEQKEKKREKFSPDGVYYLVPQQKADMEFMLDVDRQTRSLVYERFSTRSNSDWEAYTVAVVVIDTLCEALAGECRKNFGKATTIQFYDMLNISTSHRVNNRAEKIGSINAVFSPGDALDRIAEAPDKFWEIDHKVKSEDYFLTRPEGGESVYNLELMEVVSKAARTILSSKYHIIMKDAYRGIPLAVTYVFLERCYKKLIEETIARPDKDTISRVTFNLGTLIRLNGREKQDGLISIELQPGPGAKKEVKSDNTTERENED